MSDFTNEIETYGTFSTYELDEGVDFTSTGDFGVIVISGTPYGEGEYGEGPYGGGDQTLIVEGSFTEWTNVDTP